jgi:hypothetical protein
MREMAQSLIVIGKLAQDMASGQGTRCCAIPELFSKAGAHGYRERIAYYNFVFIGGDSDETYWGVGRALRVF